ncbi:outer membrane beta-barrel protein [Spirosoma sp. KCTC 42546]|uniref:outer membrane beta-barrel protein n=1 Tax=Spirosoma sp. KCTC 42546 TaxID=2520506 RepID=UPI001158DACE|nr:outer membrane beta-barrel protein [Spirosoma sp. KCTC 42546]QDK79945.1 outer membrane beta-barrel protein [Spirosoma sp. KCTC 42546]
MKSLSLFVGLFGLSITLLSAQSRVSIAPTYWFAYNPYSYQLDMTYNAVPTQIQAAGYNTVSSLGLTTRYHVSFRWDLSVGVLYQRNTDHVESPQGPYSESATFISKGVQIPVVLSYRLNDHRLSPYFSAGALFTKSITFTEALVKTDGLIGVGLDYQLHSGLSLLVQPTASYGIFQPVPDAFPRYINYRSYSLGIQTQLIWHF